MDDLSLLVDLHRGSRRQGPGGDDETRLAITLSRLRGRRGLQIADIGCGTGASTRVLAGELDADVVAVDCFPEFLQELEASIAGTAAEPRVRTQVASMEALPFAERSLDAIWSEGAIYNMGFLAGIRAWRRFLKPSGVLAVSELTWLTDSRPQALHQHWVAEYPEVDTAAAKIRALEDSGYTPLGYFVLPPHCWLDNYYRPLQGRLPSFLSRHAGSADASAIAAAEEQEIALYEQNSAFVSYGYYIAMRSGD